MSTKLLVITAIYVGAWGATMVLVPGGLLHAAVQVLGFPGLCATVLIMRRLGA